MSLFLRTCFSAPGRWNLREPSVVSCRVAAKNLISLPRLRLGKKNDTSREFFVRVLKKKVPIEIEGLFLSSSSASARDLVLRRQRRACAL